MTYVLGQHEYEAELGALIAELIMANANRDLEQARQAIAVTTPETAKRCMDAMYHDILPTLTEDASIRAVLLLIYELDKSVKSRSGDSYN